MDSKNSLPHVIIGALAHGKTRICRPGSKLTISTHIVDGRPVTFVFDPLGELKSGAGR